MMSACSGSESLPSIHSDDSISLPSLHKEEAQKVRRHKHQRSGNYDKSLDMSFSRGSASDSMLAYTERVQHIARTRGLAIRPQQGYDRISNSQLLMKSRHLPKNRMLPRLFPRRGQKRIRYDSFDSDLESIGSGRDSTSSLSKEKLRMNFVSASDLHDLVDYNFLSRGTRQESLNLAALDKNIDELEKQAKGRDIIATKINLTRTTPSPKMKPTEKKSAMIMEVKGDKLDSITLLEREPTWSKIERIKVASLSKGTEEEEKGESDKHSMFDLKPLKDTKKPRQNKPIREGDYGKFTVLSSDRRKISRFRKPKRMKLHRANLDAIPEDEMNENGPSAGEHESTSKDRIRRLPDLNFNFRSSSSNSRQNSPSHLYSIPEMEPPEQRVVTIKILDKGADESGNEARKVDNDLNRHTSNNENEVMDKKPPTGLFPGLHVRGTKAKEHNTTRKQKLAHIKSKRRVKKQIHI